MRAYIELKATPHYRRDAFVQGLDNAGFNLTDRPEKAHAVLLWNRIGSGHHVAMAAEEKGIPVLIAENAYLGNDWLGDRWYAMSRTHHNGAGFWPDHGGARWDSLGASLTSWRSGGAEIVVLPQRGIGPPGVRMPPDWECRVRSRLASYGMPVRIRRHPGQSTATPLLVDLQNAAAVVTWGSGAGIKALAAGIPVLHDFGQWIGAQASAPIGEPIRRNDADRLAMFQRLAWAQWTLDEIRSGFAITELLKCRSS